MKEKNGCLLIFHEIYKGNQKPKVAYATDVTGRKLENPKWCMPPT